MAIPARGLRDIRTHSGGVDQAHLPYRAYLKLSCLEMEKARRGKERDSAGQRIAHIEARFQEMEVEKRKLLRSLVEHHGDSGPGAASAKQGRAEPGSPEDGFKIRY